MPEKVSILIVDDDEEALETLSDILREKGFYTETAKTGKEAITKAEERFFNVALIDIKLPDITGIEVLQALNQKRLSIMTIMMTAYAKMQNAVDAVNLGANAYIMKPIDQETLDRTIEDCLKKQQQFILRDEIPSSLRKPEIKVFLRAVKNGKIAEFRPLFSHEEGIFYPDVQEIFPDTSTFYGVCEELEEYGIVKREFCDSILECSSCKSLKIIPKFQCPFCGSANLDEGEAIEHLHCGNIDMHEKHVKGKKMICPKCHEESMALSADYRQLGKLFRCHDCGKIMMRPKHEYTCGDCGKNHTENELNVRKMSAFIIVPTHKTLIDKWVKDLDNILESAREFYRGTQPPLDSERPRASYSAMAKKGESIRYAEEKVQK